MQDSGLEPIFDGAYLMLSFLKNQKEGKPDGIINTILLNDSYQLMMQHHGLMRDVMLNVLKCISIRTTLQDKTEKLVFESLVREIDRLDKIDKFLDEIQDCWKTIAYSSMNAALKYLPAEARVKAKVHFIFGGHSDGYTVGEDNILFNISMFFGNLTYLRVIMSHGLHHMGLSSIETKLAKATNSKEEKMSLLLGATKGEGIATYVMYQLAKEEENESWIGLFQERLKTLKKTFKP